MSRNLSNLEEVLPALGAVLRVIDSCGGSQFPEESDDHHAGYRAALGAVEREMKRAWPRITEFSTCP